MQLWVSAKGNLLGSQGPGKAAEIRLVVSSFLFQCLVLTSVLSFPAQGNTLSSWAEEIRALLGPH